MVIAYWKKPGGTIWNCKSFCAMCGVLYPDVCCREEMVLELRNEVAALKAQLELQAQEVNVLLEYFNEL